MRTWRLLLDPPASGAWNMAVDLAMLEAVRAGSSPPTLRIYEWERPTVSLGYAQGPDAVDRAACEREGVAMVRRPTGGRAVLHGVGDLTYAVAATEADGFPSDVSGTYCRIARALETAFTRLGLEVVLEAGSRSVPGSAQCFATATRADLVAAGRKLVGSAQVRREGGFLQHGAIMLAQPPEALGRYLTNPGPTGHRATIQELLGRLPDRSELERALIEGFGAEWKVAFVPGSLTPGELQSAEGNVRNAIPPLAR